MTSFKPGDRVTDRKRIGTVVACGITERAEHVVCVEYGSPLQPQFTHESVAKTNLRPAWQVCKDCAGFKVWSKPTPRAGATQPCPTCKGTGRINRTGPYRLASGEWSDGHDRRRRINTRSYPLPWEVWQFPADKTIWLVGNPRGLTTFPTHAEAINYATRMAQQGGK